VDRIAEALRPQWSALPELAKLPLSAEMQEIRWELEGDAMEIRNELLRCRGLRKIHLETAHVGRNLDILHCVMFPDPCFDLPLFGADIVASRGVVSAAIVDLSPSGERLPAALAQALAALPKHPYSQPNIMICRFKSIFKLKKAKSSTHSWRRAINYRHDFSLYRTSLGQARTQF
jgi:phycocyanobilin:ferredoxin oxidoreductase